MDHSKNSSVIIQNGHEGSTLYRALVQPRPLPSLSKPPVVCLGNTREVLDYPTVNAPRRETLYQTTTVSTTVTTGEGRRFVSVDPISCRATNDGVGRVSSCSSGSCTSAESSPLVIVSNYPLSYQVQKQDLCSSLTYDGAPLAAGETTTTLIANGSDSFHRRRPAVEVVEQSVVTVTDCHLKRRRCSEGALAIGASHYTTFRGVASNPGSPVQEESNSQQGRKSSLVTRVTVTTPRVIVRKNSFVESAVDYEPETVYEYESCSNPGIAEAVDNQSLQDSASNSPDCRYEFVDEKYAIPKVKGFHPLRIVRSVSDEGSEYQYSELPQQTGIAVQHCDIAPLDLSMNKCANLCAPARRSSDSGSQASSAKPNLLDLAEAASYMVQHDPQSSQAFYSASRGSPSSFSSTSSSSPSIYSEEKPMINEHGLIEHSEGYMTESPVNDCQEGDLKYEVGVGDFPPEGIILNSNVVGDQVYHDDRIFCPVEQIDVCHSGGDDTVVTDVANLSVEDGILDHHHHHDEHHYGLHQQQQVYDPSSYTTFFAEEVIPDNRSNGRHCMAVSRSNSSSSGDESLSSMNSVGMDGRYELSNGLDVLGGLTHQDGKRRLRLGKAEYESMTEEDRRIRHRVLDNQRSKQYRERRRKMVSSLQTEITELENTNQNMQQVYNRLQHQKKIMLGAIELTERNYRLAQSSVCVKSEC